MPDDDCKIDIRHFVLLAIANCQSKFDNSSYGGIAQLVERQLCKLEVRGSNPLASKAESVEAKIYNPGTFSDALAGA